MSSKRLGDAPTTAAPTSDPAAAAPSTSEAAAPSAATTQTQKGRDQFDPTRTRHGGYLTVRIGQGHSVTVPGAGFGISPPSTATTENPEGIASEGGNVLGGQTKTTAGEVAAGYRYEKPLNGSGTTLRLTAGGFIGGSEINPMTNSSLEGTFRYLHIGPEIGLGLYHTFSLLGGALRLSPGLYLNAQAHFATGFGSQDFKNLPGTYRKHSYDISKGGGYNFQAGFLELIGWGYLRAGGSVAYGTTTFPGAHQVGTDPAQPLTSTALSGQAYLAVDRDFDGSSPVRNPDPKPDPNQCENVIRGTDGKVSDANTRVHGSAQSLNISIEGWLDARKKARDKDAAANPKPAPTNEEKLVASLQDQIETILIGKGEQRGKTGTVRLVAHMLQVLYPRVYGASQYSGDTGAKLLNEAAIKWINDNWNVSKLMDAAEAMQKAKPGSEGKLKLGFTISRSGSDGKYLYTTESSDGSPNINCAVDAALSALADAAHAAKPPTKPADVCGINEVTFETNLTKETSSFVSSLMAMRDKIRTVYKTPEDRIQYARAALDEARKHALANNQVAADKVNDYLPDTIVEFLAADQLPSSLKLGDDSNNARIYFKNDPSRPDTQGQIEKVEHTGCPTLDNLTFTATAPVNRDRMLALIKQNPVDIMHPWHAEPSAKTLQGLLNYARTQPQTKPQNEAELEQRLAILRASPDFRAMCGGSAALVETEIRNLRKGAHQLLSLGGVTEVSDYVEFDDSGKEIKRVAATPDEAARIRQVKSKGRLKVFLRASSPGGDAVNKPLVEERRIPALRDAIMPILIGKEETDNRLTFIADYTTRVTQDQQIQGVLATGARKRPEAIKAAIAQQEYMNRAAEIRLDIEDVMGTASAAPAAAPRPAAPAPRPAAPAPRPAAAARPAAPAAARPAAPAAAARPAAPAAAARPAAPAAAARPAAAPRPATAPKETVPAGTPKPIPAADTSAPPPPPPPL